MHTHVFCFIILVTLYVEIKVVTYVGRYGEAAGKIQIISTNTAITSKTRVRVRVAAVLGAFTLILTDKARS